MRFPYKRRFLLSVFRIMTACSLRSLMFCTAHPILLGWLNRAVRWAEHVACMGERRGVFKVLVGKPKGNRPLGRPRVWVTGLRRFERPYSLRLLRHIQKDLNPQQRSWKTAYLAWSSKFRIRNMYKNNLVTKSEYIYFPIAGNTVTQNEAELWFMCQSIIMAEHSNRSYDVRRVIVTRSKRK
jgi:hypothetical protein